MNKKHPRKGVFWLTYNYKNRSFRGSSSFLKNKYKFMKRFYKESLRLTFLSIVIFFLVSWEMGYTPKVAVVEFVQFVKEDPINALKYLLVVLAAKIVLFMVMFIIFPYLWRWSKNCIVKIFRKIKKRK